MKFGHARTAWMLVAYLVFFDGFFSKFYLTAYHPWYSLQHTPMQGPNAHLLLQRVQAQQHFVSYL